MLVNVNNQYIISVERIKIHQNVSQSDSMTDLGKGLLHSVHATAGREDRLPQVTSPILRCNIKLTLSEGLPQLFGNPLHRLGRDLGPKVTVKRRRCSSLSKESKCITSFLTYWACFPFMLNTFSYFYCGLAQYWLNYFSHLFQTICLLYFSALHLGLYCIHWHFAHVYLWNSWLGFYTITCTLNLLLSCFTDVKQEKIVWDQIQTDTWNCYNHY